MITTANARTTIRELALMTMVIDNQGRHFGGIHFDPMYPNGMHTAPQFSDPWSHQTSNQGYPTLSKPDTSRPQMSMPYSHMPPVSAPLTSGSQFSTMGYGGSDVLSLGQDIPRSQYPEQQNYSASTGSGTTYVPTYPSLNYAQTLAHQQHEQQRKLSQRYVTTDPSRRINN